jgi:hypothetical protein
MIDICFRLVVAHFIGDVALQTPWLANNKRTNLLFLVAHSFIYGGCIYCLLFQNTAIGVFATVTHFVIDWMKCRKLIGLMWDQVWHAVVLIIIGLYVKMYLI